jgi:pimeloyl-ACP methyl ester carboxylesterase
MKGYVSTDWGQLHYRSGGGLPGQGMRTVVMLHESPRTSAVYDEVLESFGSDVSVVAFDTPGFGSSDPAPQDRPLTDYAAIFEQAIAALGITDFVVVGMKTGGYLAIHLADRLGAARVPAAVLYAMDAADVDSNEFWADNWAPALDFSDGAALFDQLWKKNLAIYGVEASRECAEAVADTVANADRYNSIYPAVFRGMSGTFAALDRVIASGVAVTMLEPPEAHMTTEEDIQFVRIPGTTTIEMPVSGQFPRRATAEFVAAVEGALAVGV